MNPPVTLKFDFFKDPFGGWTLRTDDGQTFNNVSLVRPFPISAPTPSVSILSHDGRELIWIDDMTELPGPLQESLIEALTQGEFMPEIERLVGVSSYTTPSTWLVQTDRGQCELVLKGEENIRRLNAETLIIADACGVDFIIRRPSQLDLHSRRLLDRFM